jgi:hypothetical protein
MLTPSWLADSHAGGPEPGERERDDPRMQKPSYWAVTLALSLSLAPIDRALASPPETPPEGPLRIVTEEPITFSEPPAPVIEPEPAPTSSVPAVDSRRPMAGTGLIAFGALSMGVSAALVISALAGPGWADLSKRDAAILGGLSLPVGLAGTAMVAAGHKTNRRYNQWVERNMVSPPPIGNAALVAGASVTLAGVAGLGVATQLAITDPNPSRGDWALVGVSGAITGVGLLVLCNGMLARSKFAQWERAAYLQPGTMALRGGAGLSISGRF